MCITIFHWQHFTSTGNADARVRASSSDDHETLNQLEVLLDRGCFSLLLFYSVLSIPSYVVTFYVFLTYSSSCSTNSIYVVLAYYSIYCVSDK